MSSSSDSSEDDSSDSNDYATTSFLIRTDKDSDAAVTSRDNDAEAGMANVVGRNDLEVQEIVDLDTMKRTVGTTIRSSDDQHDRVDGTVMMRKTKDLGQSQSSPFRRQARLSKILQEDDSSSDEELYTICPTPRPLIPIVKPPTQQLQQSTMFASNRMEDIIQPEYNVSDDPSKNVREREMVPMQILSKIVNPDVLSEVKSHLKTVDTITKSGHITPQQIEASPARLWEMKKKMQNEKVLLNKAQASKIKAGWKIRQCLANLPEGDNINTLYLTLVRRGMHREVEALFKMAKVTRGGPFADFDRNFLNEDCKSALIIAIDMKDESMMRKLMENGVRLGLSIFHAIEADFMEGLKLILAYNPCVKLEIENENSHFKLGMTPMLMAAHKNNYRILSLLHEYGHRLTEMKDWIDGIQVAWESSNERRMICLARAQPAYITLTTEVNQMNPMKYCLKEIKRLRRCASEEHEFGAFYKEIRNKYEEYMCSLLDFVCSSDELSDIFQYERPPPQKKKKDQIVTYIDGTRSKRWRYFSSFEILERASRENLVKFVTHQQSQLALSCMRYRSLPLLRNNLYAYAIGLLFPILSLCYICAPDTAVGGLITLPVVSFYCHMMSDLAFASLLLSKILVRDVEFDRLGEPVSALEWVIFLWILGKWVQECQECINRGFKAYIRDIWNYTDLTLLTLFTTSIVIRLYDAVFNANREHISRYEWGSFEPRLIGEGMQAFGYVFLFLRLLGLMRADRYLGPLQISLGKMLADIVRFLCLFALVLGAFAFGLSDLYWYYGTKEGSKVFCNETATNSSQKDTQNCQKRTVAFTSILDSIAELFWALFGLFDLDKMSLGGKHVYTEYIGRALVATYHVVAIIVMLNMLIAMMSKTYEDTSENEEIAWKFHRTSVWIRFIRREVVRPPPMNLFPNPWRFKENMRRLRDFFRQCRQGSGLTHGAYNAKGRRIPRSRSTPKPSRFCCRGTQTGDLEENIVETDNHLADLQGANDGGPKPTPSGKSPTRKQLRHQTPRFNAAVVSGVKAALRANVRNNQSKAVLTKLVFRYKIKNLTKK